MNIFMTLFLIAIMYLFCIIVFFLPFWGTLPFVKAINLLNEHSLIFITKALHLVTVKTPPSVN